MKLQFLLGFFLLAFVAASEPTLEDVEDAHMYDEEVKEVEPQRLRRNMKKGSRSGQNNNGNGNNGQRGNNGLIEIRPCIPFNEISPQQINDPFGNADKTCATNTCGGGCCRAYNWLLCDEKNAYPYVECVCNENTQNPDPNTFVPSTIPSP